ncbi:alpha-scruin [Trichonephila clavipes]|uniref:Alpha-scruin n=1 Tax=Trichonephila clavipes TaxID=2585209 RepID=A0A8X6VHG5_TRICX|nr:alpha-scruin [Trichonephila clavipes]
MTWTSNSFTSTVGFTSGVTGNIRAPTAMSDIGLQPGSFKRLQKHILCNMWGCHPELTKEGKMVPLKSCYSFNLTTKEWKKLPEMRNARMYHGVAALKGKIYVVGGKRDNDKMLDSVEVYNTKTNTWTIVDSLDYPTMGAGVCSHRGQVWVIGGMSESRGKINLIHEVRCYDPKMGEWIRNIPNLPYPRAFIGAVECMNRVFVMGGTSYADSDIYSDELNSLDEVIYFEEDDRTWKTITPMMDPRHFVGAAAVVCLLSVNMQYQQLTIKQDLTSPPYMFYRHSWMTDTLVLPVQSYRITARTSGGDHIVITRRSLFALGGLSSCQKDAIDEVNVYTETNKQWHNCTNLPACLCGFAATAIPSILD